MQMYLGNLSLLDEWTKMHWCYRFECDNERVIHDEKEFYESDTDEDNGDDEGDDEDSDDDEEWLVMKILIIYLFLSYLCYSEIWLVWSAKYI